MFGAPRHRAPRTVRAALWSDVWETLRVKVGDSVAAARVEGFTRLVWMKVLRKWSFLNREAMMRQMLRLEARNERQLRG